MKQALENPSHVLHAPTKDKWDRWPRDTLRLSFADHPFAKIVVRNHVKRRIKGAFHKALQLRGYDRYGRMLDGSGGPGLVGSLHITPTIYGLHAEHAQLVRGCSEIVTHIEHTKSARSSGETTQTYSSRRYPDLQRSGRSKGPVEPFKRA